MDQDEIETWIRADPALRSCPVREAVRLAYWDWLERMPAERELRDVADFSLSGVIMPTRAAQAASVVAGELAVVCLVFPAPVDAALQRISNPG